MRYWVIILSLLMLSCSDQKTVLLPEIGNAKITEVNDVSAAYLFYDITQPDSVAFNRKNIISTTNWLVNVDQRLTLKQAVPHLKYLQDKRRNAKMHKNEAARNYFTCNDTIIKNLGFIDFTDITYDSDDKIIDLNYSIEISNKDFSFHNTDSTKLADTWSGYVYRILDLKFGFDNFYYISDNSPISHNVKLTEDVFYNYLVYVFESETIANAFKIKLHFNGSISFQEYITVKSKLSQISNNKTIIESIEFIY